ncbi:EamA family transporter [Rhodospirillum rubrum]|uniref:DMT family transporter n=1 Tax=Rhodospirillum rubrum TaxID=1085 RepID=UPI0019049282|nr:DMT family transporter [Rhodospirillum rubrum]MBK1663839.1 EamA family transporter [Rhodospirillum rubrum]MBK1677917.1 EamA family transporter [Rhodospirillum rubrum]
MAAKTMDFAGPAVSTALGALGPTRLSGAALMATLLFLGAPLLFAGNMLAARMMQGVLPPFTLASARWALAALVLLPFVRRELFGQRRAVPGRWRALVLPAVLGGALSVGPQYWAAHFTPAGNIALVFAMTPLLVALLDRLAGGARLGAPALAGMGLAIAGIATASFQGSLARLLAFQVNPGDLLAGLAALAWAGYTVATRRPRAGLSGLALLWGVAAGGALTLAPAAAVEWLVLGVPSLSREAVLGVAFLAIVPSIGAYLAYGRLIGLVGPVVAGTSMYLIPLYALALGAMVLGEALGRYHLAAAALVIGGVALSRGSFARKTAR